MSIIDQIREPVARQFRQYEHFFEDAFHTDNIVLEDVARHIISRRGKQLRPLLVLLCAQACRGINDKTYQTAVALELLHTASLIHDDVVDESDERRGKSTIHRQWNNKVAILCGDFLLSRVIEIVASLRNVRILGLVSDLGSSLAAGELLQLKNSFGRYDVGQKESLMRDYFRVIEQKTARLFSVCAQAGAISSGATPKQENALRHYGTELGMCFQMQDDILDFSDSEELGKPTLNDVREGKRTLPLLISLDRATPQERSQMETLLTDITHLTGNELFEAEQEVKSFVMRYDGVHFTHQQMMQHRQKALNALEVFHPNSVINSLVLLLDYSINRMR